MRIPFAPFGYGTLKKAYAIDIPHLATAVIGSIRGRQLSEPSDRSTENGISYHTIGLNQARRMTDIFKY